MEQLELVRRCRESIEESAKDLNILNKDEDVLNWRRDIHAELDKLQKELLN